MRTLSIAILAAMLAAPAYAETITLVADRWCPYNCEPGSKHPGFMIELAKKAFARHDIKVTYELMPWTRAIEETRGGKHTAIVGSARKDAPDFIFPDIPQGHMHNMFYVKQGNSWRFTSMGSLHNVSVGVVADYSYTDEMDEYIAKHKDDLKAIQISTGDDALDINVKKLLAGRVDTVLEGSYVMSYYLMKHRLSDRVEKAGGMPSTDNDDVFIAFSPAEPRAKEYAKIMADEMRAMRQSGELKKILSAYSVEDWQP